MSRSCSDKPFRPVRIAVLTVSDTRGADEDTAGDLLSESLQAAGHELTTRDLEPDDVHRLRATGSNGQNRAAAARAWVLKKS